MDKAGLAYRPCVGIFLFNRDKKIWIGKRAAHLLVDSHLYEDRHLWQMPQGGIDDNESPDQALARELFEETGIRNFEIIETHPDWLTYDLPDHLIGKALKGNFRGQRQKWFALEFKGKDEEIDLNTQAEGEFTAWRWAGFEELLDLVVPFKLDMYRQVCRHFSKLL